MKTLLNKLFYVSSIISIVVLFNSCSSDRYSHYAPKFEKRRYSQGFYSRTQTTQAARGTKINAVETINEVWKPGESLRIPVAHTNYSAIVSKPVLPVAIDEAVTIHHFGHRVSPVICDVILYRDGREREVKIEDVSANEVRYRPCRDPNGPLNVEGTANILRIDYADGSRRYFEQRDNVDRQNQQVIVNQNVNVNSAQRDGQTRSHSQIVALLLILFLGGLAAHRFYLGYYGIAILQLITFGACGIWYLIDLIRIVTGDLKPRNSDDYAEKL